MYTPVMATLRYGKLGSGIHIPCAYALEREDGKSILFQNGNDFSSLAYYLGAPVNPDYATYDEFVAEHDKAVAWLDEHTGEEFDIAGSYGDLEEEAWE
jgi:hypothetical protein